MVFLICFSMIFFLCSINCQSAPEKKDYIHDECFVALDCMYRINSDKDKAICSLLIESCRDALKEQRGIDRLRFCRDFKPAGMSESECRLWLNQK